MSHREDQIKGLLLGTAVGDSLGLPTEGLSAARIKKYFKEAWRHRFFFGKGMLSDDTQHTIFVSHALLSRPQNVDHFLSCLAWKFRLWFLGIPAGIGFATLRAILKLWVGVSPERSGVFSAGNGPAMRSAIIGAFFASSPLKIHKYVEACTRITHIDPKAFTGALAVASVSGWIFRNSFGCSLDVEEIFSLLRKSGSEDDEEWQEILRKMRESWEKRKTLEEFASEMNLSKGVSGYSYHTVPIAIYSWMRYYGDFRTSLISVLDCGGDTDTVGAIAGAISGATVGEKGIPKEWIENIWDWPLGVKFLNSLGERLSKENNEYPEKERVPFYWVGLFPRNLFFLIIVLLHGFRRLAPPYS